MYMDFLSFFLFFFFHLRCARFAFECIRHMRFSPRRDVMCSSFYCIRAIIIIHLSCKYLFLVFKLRASTFAPAPAPELAKLSTDFTFCAIVRARVCVHCQCDGVHQIDSSRQRVLSIKREWQWNKINKKTKQNKTTTKKRRRIFAWHDIAFTYDQWPYSMWQNKFYDLSRFRHTPCHIQPGSQPFTQHYMWAVMRC